jgi:hypothetical protein
MRVSLRKRELKRLREGERQRLKGASNVGLYASVYERVMGQRVSEFLRCGFGFKRALPAVMEEGDR